jgi:hypothetical protein
MAAPFPPQGEQKQQTEKPLKVYSEQYLEGQPLPVGATVEPMMPPMDNATPRVYANGRVYVLAFGDYVISSRFTGKPIEVISAEEHAERFGPSADVVAIP